MFMKWESVVKKMFPLFATFVKRNKQFFKKNTFLHACVVYFSSKQNMLFQND